MRVKKKKTALGKYVFGGLFFCILAGLAYVLIWWPYLWVTDIEVEGKAIYYSDSDIKEITWTKIEFPFQSIVLVRISQIEEEVLNQYPEIKGVVINRQLPNVLKIVIEERERAGVWCQIEKGEELEEATTTEQTIGIKKEKEIKNCFYFDPQGFVFREAPLIKGTLILNVYGTEESIQVGGEVLSPELIQFVTSVKEGLPEIETASGWSPKAVDFETISYEDLRMTTDQGWEIYFNPVYPAEKQLNALSTIFSQEVNPEEILEYVDLRIEGRVYYR